MNKWLVKLKMVNCGVLGRKSGLNNKLYEI